MRAVNRLIALGAVVLVVGFTALAAQATPPRHASTRPAAIAAGPATRTEPTPRRVSKRVTRHHRHQSRRHTTAAKTPKTITAAPSSSSPSAAAATPAASQPTQPTQPTQAAPVPTTQAPVAVSGGS